MRLLLAILLVTWPGQAQEEPQNVQKNPKVAEPLKPAWQWTLDERLAKRLDSNEIRERAAAHERFLGKDPQRVQVQEAGPAQYIIEGRRDPALFMPFELFVSLLRGVTPPTNGIPPDSRDAAREQYRIKIAEVGWQEDEFWKTVEAAAADYLHLQTERLALQLQIRTLPPPERRKLEARVEELSHKQCVARAEAIRTARGKLGPEPFDRFLYDVVASGMALMSSEPDDESRLRFLEGGCQ